MQEPKPIQCPKCGSTQISANKNKFEKVIITCLQCGNEWKPGETAEQSKIDERSGSDATLGCLAVIVVAAIAFFIFKTCGKKDNVVVEKSTYSVAPVKLSKEDSIKKEKEDSLYLIEKSKLFKAQMETDRINYVNDLRNRFLDAGLDIKCTDIKTKSGHTLKLKFSLFSDVWKRKFETEKVLNEAFSYFNKIELTDGYDYNAVMY